MARKTEIIIILDRSGSMQSTKHDAIGGFNSFVAEQKKIEGEATLTLVQFDTYYEVNYEDKDIMLVEELNERTYVPRGSTALIDAMGRAIFQAESRWSAKKKEEQPNMVVVIITDGEENSSREYLMSDVNARIGSLREKGWEFVFIGANQDAIKTGARFGIAAENSLSYACNSIGTQALFSSVSKNVGAYRCGAKADMSFDASDILAQTHAGVIRHETCDA